MSGVGGNIDYRCNHRVDGGSGHGGNGGDDVGAHGGNGCNFENASFRQLRSELGNSVVRFPCGEFFLAAIDIGVGGRVSTDAVAFNIEKCRAFARQQQGAFSRHRIGHGQRIGAVDGFGMHGFGVNGGGDARQAVPAHGLTNGLPTHRVEIVVEAEQHRKATLVSIGPQSLVLCHGGEIHGLEHRATARRSVTRQRHRDGAVSRQLLAQCGTRGDPRRGTDNGIVGIGTKGREEGMHGAAHATVEAIGLHEDFGEQSEQQIVLGQSLASSRKRFLDGAQQPAALEVFHDAEAVTGR